VEQSKRGVVFSRPGSTFRGKVVIAKLVGKAVRIEVIFGDLKGMGNSSFAGSS